MSLYQNLQAVQSEEDVKDLYIKALRLKSHTKGLIDIQTDEIWFEAKHKPTDAYTMFAQLLYYVCHAHKKGETLPPLLCVIDNEKAALMATDSIKPIFKDKNIPWGKSASQVSRELVEKVSPYITDHFIVYHIKDDEAAFLQAVKDSIKNGGIVRTQITPDNLKAVFDRWVEMIGRELSGVAETDYVLLFYADIMSDGSRAVIGDEIQASLIHKNNKPAFILRGKIHELGSLKGYQDFWNIYHRPPAEEYRSYLLERRDSLIPLDERQFKGAYYTPIPVVAKAYELLTQTLGKNWQKNYIVWDMCCGVGNLEAKHGNQLNVFMSTLDEDDINVMQTSGNFPAATRFQYDYLNDDIADDGSIDYTLSGKMPQELRDLIQAAQADKKKKILVLINPPYGEAASADTVSGNAENKTGISNQTKITATQDLGYASRELFVQFLLRIQRELPNAVVAVFSKLKYITAPNFQLFREVWQPKFLNGFVVHSKAFDGLKGNFPIGFLIWDLAKKGRQDSFQLACLNRNAENSGEKTFYRETGQVSLNDWIERAKPNDQNALPLKNALTPTTSTKDVRGTKWADGAIGGMMCKGNDFQNAAKSTALFSSGYCSAGGFLVTESNLKKAAVVFAVRRLIKPTWLNDRDQFLQPAAKLPESFYTDCLIWMLFSGSNLTAGTAENALEWNGKKWRLTNHFIPFTEQQAGAKRKFQSHFMSDYLRNKKLSKETQAVFDAGKAIWQAFFKADLGWKIRKQYLLDNHSDAGWYQIRNALKDAGAAVDFSAFETAYAALTEKLQPLVYEYGFLKE